MIHVREESAADVAAREFLLDAAMGDARFRKTSARLRDGRLAAEGLSLVAESEGAVIGTVRLWHVAAGDRASLLLGPLAVSAGHRALGVGGRLMREALSRAAGFGHGSVVLVGDPAYYQRFGFSAEAAAGLWMPGPFERHRLLGCELRHAALAGSQGLIKATGARIAIAPAARAA